MFAGWYRPPGGCWGKVCEAPSHGCCLDALFETVGCRSGDLMVIRAHDYPLGKKYAAVDGPELAFHDAEG
jgi:hypothetical protein